MLEALAKHGIAKPVLLLGIADTVTEHGDPAKLLADLGLNAEGIRTQAEQWLAAQATV